MPSYYAQRVDVPDVPVLNLINLDTIAIGPHLLPFYADHGVSLYDLTVLQWQHWVLALGCGVQPYVQWIELPHLDQRLSVGTILPWQATTWHAHFMHPARYETPEWPSLTSTAWRRWLLRSFGTPTQYQCTPAWLAQVIECGTYHAPGPDTHAWYNDLANYATDLIRLLDADVFHTCDAALTVLWPPET